MSAADESAPRRRGLRARALNRIVNPPTGVSGSSLERAVSGRTALVTGASHGIGRATAVRLAEAGASVLMVARSGEVLDELAAELDGRGLRARAFATDLSDPDAVGELVPRLIDADGRVDLVVNNAGKSIRRSVAASTERFHDVTRTVGINYLGPVRLLLGLLPLMRDRGDGHIVNVSTIGVLLPPAPSWGAYCGSKAAFDVWLRSATAETEADGVTSTSVYLALVHTRMSAPTRDFDNVPGLQPEEAAGVVCRAIVHRPPAIAPWWATAGNVAAGVARGPTEALTRRYGRTVPQSDHGPRA